MNAGGGKRGCGVLGSLWRKQVSITNAEKCNVSPRTLYHLSFDIQLAFGFWHLTFIWLARP
jgi:hypothetical protein